MGGISASVTFTVEVCSFLSSPPMVYILPAGQIFRSGSVANFSVIFNRGFRDSNDFPQYWWRIVVNDRNVTDDVNRQAGIIYHRGMATCTPAGGSEIQIPIPFALLDDGENDLKVEMLLIDGTTFTATQRIEVVHPPSNTIPLLPPPRIPDSPMLTCVLQKMAGFSAVYHAEGGDGSFSWNAVGGDPQIGSGDHFSTIFRAPGDYTVTLSSKDGAMKKDCQMVSVRGLPPSPPVSIP